MTAALPRLPQRLCWRQETGQAMAGNETERQLKHELANARQQKKALQKMLERASDEIEELVEGGCDEAHKREALKAAERFRRAASL